MEWMPTDAKALDLERLEVLVRDLRADAGRKLGDPRYVFRTILACDFPDQLAALVAIARLHTPPPPPRLNEDAQP